MKPITLPVKFDNIPNDLKRVPRWVLWKLIEVGDDNSKRWSKMPVRASGQYASSTNSDTWADFFSVQSAYEANPSNFAGIGFVFTADDNLVGIDLDDCYENDIVATDFANDILRSVPGYCEVSPSGTGVKLFTRATINNAHVDHNQGLEIYPHGRFFTVTGHTLGGHIPEAPCDLSAIMPNRTAAVRTGDTFADYNPPLEGYDINRVETEILARLDPDCGYHDWIKIGAILHHQFAGDVEACEAWDRWSSQGASYKATGSDSCATKWRTFKGSGATLRSLVFQVNQMERQEALERGEIILGNSVMEHARTFLDSVHATEEGRKLVHYAQDFYHYTGTHYDVMEEATVRAQVYTFLDRCRKAGRGGALVPFNPTPASVSAALDGVKALVHLANAANTKPPIWLETYRLHKPTANKLISLQNGLFHLQDSTLHPHSLGFFTQNSLPFNYDTNAKCPTWDNFLTSIWGDDPQSIGCLQEIFGYILSGDTSQQKFFNVIGPRRSGKGTINKVLVSLLGQHNTVAPELGELCDTFGLQPWLGKLLASFTDARAPERNRSAVVSQLLRIVGGDTITVNRKNKEAWNGYLPTRIVVYSNEVLQLTENSNALTGRMVVLKMTKSFFDKEDTDLAIKLERELSGIFNWAMEGLKRRIERGGHFTQPDTGKDLLELMAELGNPIGAFVEDALVYDPLGTASKDEVFACYKHWALKKSLSPGTELAFKRRFLAATQEHRVESDLDRTEGKRAHIYRGVRLNEKAQIYINNQVLDDEGVF